MLSSKIADPRNLNIKEIQKVIFSNGNGINDTHIKNANGFSKCSCIFRVFFKFVLGLALLNSPRPNFVDHIRSFSLLHSLHFIVICVAVHFKIGSWKGLFCNLVTTAINASE